MFIVSLEIILYLRISSCFIKAKLNCIIWVLFHKCFDTLDLLIILLLLLLLLAIVAQMLEDILNPQVYLSVFYSTYWKTKCKGEKVITFKKITISLNILINFIHFTIFLFLESKDAYHVLLFTLRLNNLLGWLSNHDLFSVVSKKSLRSHCHLVKKIWNDKFTSSFLPCWFLLWH